MAFSHVEPFQGAPASERRPHVPSRALREGLAMTTAVLSMLQTKVQHHPQRPKVLLACFNRNWPGLRKLVVFLSPVFSWYPSSLPPHPSTSLLPLLGNCCPSFKFPPHSQVPLLHFHVTLTLRLLRVLAESFTMVNAFA